MVTKAKELAKMLGVSQATVSLVLNNKPGISDSLRHSLIEKIKELGYEEMLRTGNINPRKGYVQSSSAPKPAIAYLIYTESAELSDRFAFYPAVLEGAEMESRDKNFTLLIYHMCCGGTCTPTSLLKDSNVIGVIVQSYRVTDEIVKELDALGLPSVFIDAYNPYTRQSSVSVNNEQGIYAAIDHLAKMGHTKIGYISSGNESDSSLERRKSFHQALLEFGLDDVKSNYYSSRGDNEDAFLNLKKVWHETPPEVTALVCENDLIAWRAMKALNRLGYNVPDDISLIGFDDRSICLMTEPPLTSVKNYRHLMGREAVMMIQNQIRLRSVGLPFSPLKLELPTELVVRESVKKLN